MALEEGETVYVSLSFLRIKYAIAKDIRQSSKEKSQRDGLLRPNLDASIRKNEENCPGANELR